MAFRTNKVPVLQEKSASGSVAAFNTALAMPLAECKVDVNAWQEGSGDPSPVNDRPIHGWTASNLTRAGKNLFNPNNITSNAYITDSGTLQTNTAWNASFYIPIKGNIQYSFYAHDTSGNLPRHAFYDVNKNFISAINSGNQIFTTPANACFARFSFRKAIVPENITLVVGQSYLTTPAPYTGNIYPIQLGQEVYGAEVDVVNGVAHVTHALENKATSAFYTFDAHTGSPCSTAYIDVSNDIKILDVYNTQSLINAGFMSNKLKTHYGSYTQNAAINAIRPYSSTNRNRMLCSFDGSVITQLSDISTVFGDTIEIMYPLANTFDIQLTPTQIETLIGNNTIFADTGDIDLTYKDLDIAKRGNFREVFKLPS